MALYLLGVQMGHLGFLGLEFFFLVSKAPRAETSTKGVWEGKNQRPSHQRCQPAFRAWSQLGLGASSSLDRAYLRVPGCPLQFKRQLQDMQRVPGCSQQEPSTAVQRRRCLGRLTLASGNEAFPMLQSFQAPTEGRQQTGREQRLS